MMLKWYQLKVRKIFILQFLFNIIKTRIAGIYDINLYPNATNFHFLINQFHVNGLRFDIWSNYLI